jgi:hypothetical protein
MGSLALLLERNLRWRRLQIGKQNFTKLSDGRHRTFVRIAPECRSGGLMPILMLALVALGAFGVIGFMLAMASTLEHRRGAKKNLPKHVA